MGGAVGTGNTATESHMPAASALSDKPLWLAAYTTPRHEKRIAEYFKMREIEHFLPLYSSRRRWKDGSKVTIELPLFPGYIFVRVCRTERVRVLESPGVLRLVGSGREVAALSEQEIETLRSGLSQVKAEPHAYLVAGDRVRIKNGPLSGMEGVLVRKKELHVVLTLNQIAQSIAVHVDALDLELLSPEATHIPFKD